MITLLAILYARFSPRPNADECESCQHQIAEMREYCLRKGYTIAGEFQDDALSGGDDWQDRPGMLAAVHACRKGMVFMVSRFDRLFRDTRKGLMLAYDLECKGVSVLSINEEAASLNTPEARLFRGLLLLMAEYQRELTKARTMAAMQRYQTAGRRMSDKTPWGTMRDPDDPARLIDDLAEEEIASQIVALHDSGIGVREIARTLEQQGIQRRGKAHWHHEIVRSILKRRKAI